MKSRSRVTSFVVLVTIAMTLVTAASAKPLKVYILVGQSNMQGKAHPRTLPAMAMDPKTRALHDKIVDAEGKPRVYKDVCLSYLTSRRGTPQTSHGPLCVGEGTFGPELAFGITMAEHLKEPILIIKTAWGGKSLCIDFRPPGAGPYQIQPHVVEYMKAHNVYEKLERNLADKRKKSGIYYNKMMEHVRTVLADPKKYCPAYDPKQGYELAGFVWFQGWNDMIDGHTYQTRGPDAFKKYTRLMAHFIQDVRKDLKAPKMPFVIGVLGVGGVTEGPFQNAQAAPAELPEFKGNVVAVRTGKYWDPKLQKMEVEFGKVRNKAWSEGKKKKLSKAETNKLQEKLKKETFTEAELKYWDMAVANAGFHYMGSAKIYSRIGEAFAKAILEIK